VGRLSGLPAAAALPRQPDVRPLLEAHPGAGSVAGRPRPSKVLPGPIPNSCPYRCAPGELRARWPGLGSQRRGHQSSPDQPRHRWYGPLGPIFPLNPILASAG
jgi:hypothetical protein